VSQVTNVIVCHWENDPARVVTDLNLALTRGDESGLFVVPSYRVRWYGGTKALTVSVLIGAFNHLTLTTLTAALETRVWEAPEHVQLFVKEHEAEKFHEVPLQVRGAVPTR
jgi:hypothetical protein